MVFFGAQVSKGGFNNFYIDQSLGIIFEYGARSDSFESVSIMILRTCKAQQAHPLWYCDLEKSSGRFALRPNWHHA